MESFDETLIIGDGPADGAHVFVGHGCGLREISGKLDWNKRNEGTPEEEECLTLREIAEQIERANLSPYMKLITVYNEHPLSGEIYQYGRDGDYWEQIGTTIGYA